LGRVRAVSVVALAVAAFVVPTSAMATIVPQKSIVGVALQMTKAQVRAKLGAPKKTLEGKNDFGPYSTWVYPRVTINFQGRKKVTSMQTLSPLERTASGVGVGSTEARVKAKVQGAKCTTTVGSRQCIVGVFKPGRTVTVFSIKAGKVRAFVVGIVID
jgi:hypothetical protein